MPAFQKRSALDMVLRQQVGNIPILSIMTLWLSKPGIKCSVDNMSRNVLTYVNKCMRKIVELSTWTDVFFSFRNDALLHCLCENTNSRGLIWGSDNYNFMPSQSINIKHYEVPTTPVIMKSTIKAHDISIIRTVS